MKATRTTSHLSPAMPDHCQGRLSFYTSTLLQHNDGQLRDRAAHPTPPGSPQRRPESPRLRLQRLSPHPPPTPPRVVTYHSSNALCEAAPATEIALQLLRDRRAYKLTPGITYSVNLDFSEYQSLLRRLNGDPDLKGFIDNKARLEYSSVDKLLQIRMPTTIHELFCGEFSKEITRQLEQISRRQDNDGHFASGIKDIRSASIFLHGSNTDDNIIFIRKDPDGQFQHEETAYPGLVIEISYSQRRKDLTRLAEDYILYSNGSIRAVVGIDLDYGKQKEARVAVWEPNFTKEEGEELDILSIKESLSWDLFRDAQGEPVSPEKEVVLPLDLFAVPDMRPENPLSPAIAIAYETLATFLNEVEWRSDIRTSANNLFPPGKQLMQKIKRRKRVPTPPEELSSDTERYHAECMG